VRRVSLRVAARISMSDIAKQEAQGGLDALEREGER